MSTQNNKRAVVLVSGGLDSATVLAMAKDQGYECYALSMNYGQRHRIELDRAQKVAQSNGAIEHRVVKIDIGGFGGSALTDQEIQVPTEATEEIPITYVPARNTVFLSVALGWAEVLDAQAIFIGANAVDYSGYPDCRPEYIAAFQSMANLATKSGVEGENIKIEAPIIDLTKSEIIQRGLELGVDYSQTISCYNPRTDGQVCHQCDSCRIRAAGFAEAGSDDPAIR
ncbi:7-cyano-7-deazaguanine synthase QueC [Arenicella sp. 4NH20-0111]|uniref:7-cyano-7-deazaguanine synthase QueC n=1 Tax=Arenicella sp. 4NH20-0111 TaxID=3127648 RepID=UPI003109834A